MLYYLQTDLFNQRISLHLISFICSNILFHNQLNVSFLNCQSQFSSCSNYMALTPQSVYPQHSLNTAEQPTFKLVFNFSFYFFLQYNTTCFSIVISIYISYNINIQFTQLHKHNFVF